MPESSSVHSLEKLHRVVADVLGVPAGEITDDTSPDTLEAWNSVAHLNLVMAIESEFGLNIGPDEVLEMISVKLIRLYLEEKDKL